MINNIIVEGADQQGKTTVCNMIAEFTGWPIKHFGPPSDDFNFHSDYLLDKHVIADRNFLSEMVYSHFRDTESRVVRPELLQDKMISQGYLLILCDRQGDFVHQAREEKFTRTEIYRARRMYRRLYFDIKLARIMINPQHDMDRVKRILNDRIQKT
jgi:thymidylate kinase